ncbi:MAG: M48 family metalloprotease, partial [Deltaproteobacteria bacterium]|nr:M48 family metalloprotease [Deltaproteobacteria bacterium]
MIFDIISSLVDRLENLNEFNLNEAEERILVVAREIFKNTPVEVDIVIDASPNSYCYINGEVIRILVTTGFLNSVQSRDDLAQVIFHELAHAVYRLHSQTSFRRESSKKEELFCDQLSALLMVLSGYDPSLSSIIQRLETSEQNPSIFALPDPHPLDYVRAYNIQKVIADLWLERDAQHEKLKFEFDHARMVESSNFALAFIELIKPSVQGVALELEKANDLNQILGYLDFEAKVEFCYELATSPLDPEFTFKVYDLENTYRRFRQRFEGELYTKFCQKRCRLGCESNLYSEEANLLFDRFCRFIFLSCVQTSLCKLNLKSNFQTTTEIFQMADYYHLPSHFGVFPLGEEQLALYLSHISYEECRRVLRKEGYSREVISKLWQIVSHYGVLPTKHPQNPSLSLDRPLRLFTPSATRDDLCSLISDLTVARDVLSLELLSRLHDNFIGAIKELDFETRLILARLFGSSKSKFFRAAFSRLPVEKFEEIFHKLDLPHPDETVTIVYDLLVSSSLLFEPSARRALEKISERQLIKIIEAFVTSDLKQVDFGLGDTDEILFKFLVHISCVTHDKDLRAKLSFLRKYHELGDLLETSKDDQKVAALPNEDEPITFKMFLDEYSLWEHLQCTGLYKILGRTYLELETNSRNDFLVISPDLKRVLRRRVDLNSIDGLLRPFGVGQPLTMDVFL